MILRDRKIGRRHSVFSSTLLRAPLMLGIAAVFNAGAAFADPAARSFAMPAQDLATALNQFSVATDRQIVFSPDLVSGLQAPELKGEYTPEQAIAVLLAGTSLTYQPMEGGVYAVFKEGEENPFAGGGQAIAQAGPPTNPESAIDPGLTDPGMVAEPTTETVTSQKRGGIEEIVVTARRRVESVQDIPVSITALSAEDLKAMGIRNIADMEGIVPGLNMGGGGNGVKKDSNPFIRGVGQRETKVTLDPAVGTYIDGIYLARTAGALLDTVGVERIEVLRGPQGTLFGKNTTGGAISITTKKPTNEWSAQVGTNVGNYGRSDVTAAVNVPLIKDTLLGRLTVSTKNSEGYFTNVVDNTKWGDDNRITGIGQIRWIPTETLTFDVLGERTRIRETPRPQKCAFVREEGFTTLQTTFVNSSGLVDGYKRFEGLCRRSESMPSDQFSSDMALGAPDDGRIETLTLANGNEVLIWQPALPKGRYWVDTSTVGLTGTWDAGDIGPLNKTQVKSISAWRRVEQIADEDLDAIGSAYLMRYQPHFDETTQLSQEVQFTGSAFNDRLFFSTGGYYFQEETPQNDLFLSAGLKQEKIGSFYFTNGFETSLERLETDNEALAWFGQVDFSISEQIEIAAGLRYTREERWSRYSKATIDAYSLVTGTPDSIGGGSDQAGGRFSMRTTGPGLAPLLDWRFGTNDYVVVPPRSGANESVGRVFVPGRMEGDEKTYKNSAWTPMISLKYQASERLLERLSLDQAMTYITYSEGFHSGGVTAGAVDYDRGPELTRNFPEETGIPCEGNVNPNVGSCNFVTYLPSTGSGYGTADPIIFKPETVKNYEVGLKTTGFGRRLQANVALFYMDYTDMQVTAIANRAGIPIPYVENVGKSVIKGVEAEFVFMPTPEWRVLMNSSYTDTDIKEWTSTVVELDALSGAPTGEISSITRDDEPMPRVPDWQAFLLTDYSILFPNGGVLTPSISARYMSEIFHGFDRGSFLYGKDKVTSEAVTFVDARIGYLSQGERFEIAVWGKNLTNIDDYLVGGIPLADVNGGVGRVYANPRTFGLTMTYNFGAQ